MKRTVQLFIALGAIFLAGSAFAQVCGSANRPESGFVAQDHWSCSTGGLISLEEGAAFWKACKTHDICYWNPRTSRQDCDHDFHGNLRSECGSAFHTVFFEPCRLNCVSHAYLYFRAVSDNGHDSFTSGHAEGQRVLDAISEEHPEFLSLGDEALDYLGQLIGEGCFVHNDVNSVCEFAKAAEHAVKAFSCRYFRDTSVGC